MEVTTLDFIPGTFAGELIDLFKTKDGVPYITSNGKTFKINGSEFKDYLNLGIFNETGDFLDEGQIRKITKKCDNFARLLGEIKPVFRRVGRDENGIYIDLGTPDFAVIEITNHSVRRITNPPVKFIRSGIQRPIGGLSTEALPKDLLLLKKYVPFKAEEDFILFVAWLLSCLNPYGGYPPLFLVGEQGSAKSTTSAFIKNLLDESSVPLRNLSKGMKNFMIAASNDFILCHDNISKITDDQSDNICKLATGAGFTTRKLYTTLEESQLNCKNPTVFNSISISPARQDLADRSVIVALSFIPPEARKTDKEIWDSWQQDRPAIMGALCNAVSACLRNYDQVDEANLPRMADFAKWVIAAEERLPWEKGVFMETMRNLRVKMVEDAVDADSTAMAVIKMMKGRDIWAGNASELLDRLEDCIDQGKHKYPDFPKLPNQLSRNLNRISAFLREKGLQVDKRHSGQRFITITNLLLVHQACQETAEMSQQEAMELVHDTFSGGVEVPEQPVGNRQGEITEEVEDKVISTLPETSGNNSEF
ncbi:MAG: hypothetical protein ABIK68_11185 [bacterium]